MYASLCSGYALWANVAQGASCPCLFTVVVNLRHAHIMELVGASSWPGSKCLVLPHSIQADDTADLSCIALVINSLISSSDFGQ